MLFSLLVRQECDWTLRCFQFAYSYLAKSFPHPCRKGDAGEASGLFKRFFFRPSDADLKKLFTPFA